MVLACNSSLLMIPKNYLIIDEACLKEARMVSVLGTWAIKRVKESPGSGSARRVEGSKLARRAGAGGALVGYSVY